MYSPGMAELVRRGRSTSITVRMPARLLLDLKQLANSRHIPYQRLLKELVARGLREDAETYSQGSVGR
jgi:predicted DNA binding CopG/RHH family protein